MNRREVLKKLKHSCLVCLSQDKKMFFLDSPLNEKSSLSILEVLEIIMYTKVKLIKSYSCVICKDCLRCLNVAYDFKHKYEWSQKILENLNNCTEEERFLENDICDIFLNDTVRSESAANSDSIKECDGNENVEIIYIKCTNNHEDLDVQQIEVEGCGDKNIFDNSSEAKDKSEKSLENEVKPLTKFRKSKQSGRKQSINVDEYIIEHMDTDIVTSDVKDLPNIDDELIQAACNLKYKCSGCPKLYSSKRKLEKHEEGCNKLKCRMNIQNLFSSLRNTSIDQDYSFLYECDKCSQVCLSMEELDAHSETAHDYANTDTCVNLKVETLSEIDKELFRSALLLKYQCDGCTKVYSSLERFNRHKTVCRKSRKPKLK